VTPWPTTGGRTTKLTNRVSPGGNTAVNHSLLKMNLDSVLMDFPLTELTRERDFNHCK
jgi:hypothetical protein